MDSECREQWNEMDDTLKTYHARGVALYLYKLRQAALPVRTSGQTLGRVPTRGYLRPVSSQSFDRLIIFAQQYCCPE